MIVLIMITFEIQVSQFNLCSRVHLIKNIKLIKIEMYNNMPHNTSYGIF